MKSIPQIINEEVISFLRETNGNVNDYYEGFDRIKAEITDDFLYNNNNEMSKKISWRVIPYPRVKKIWGDYIKYGFVRDVKGLDAIERIVIRNVLLIHVFTNFSGHEGNNFDNYFEEHVKTFVKNQINCYFQKPVDPNQMQIDFKTGGSKRPTPHEPCTVIPYVNKFIESESPSLVQISSPTNKPNPDNIDINVLEDSLYDEIMEHFFWDYMSSGDITDYGLNGLRTNAIKLYRENNSENKLQLIDKIFNVVHQSSDLSALFIEGGVNSFNDLSGYEVPDEEAGGYDTKSAISGRYKMADYR